MLRIFLKPLLTVLPPKSTLIATTLPEKFFTVLKMSFLGGFLVASPYIFYQVWRFIAPGLYKEEREALIPVSIATAFFFTGGGVFGYFVVFPFAFSFFVNYAGDLITIMPTISSYFSFAVMLLVAFGVVFELPVVLYFLARIGLVTAAGLRRNRRWAILGAFILGAILTPADPISQCLMAGPLIVLYEVGIVAAALFGKKKPPAQASDATG
jgi:sec-independent protein translocase protein TatC